MKKISLIAWRRHMLHDEHLSSRSLGNDLGLRMCADAADLRGVGALVDEDCHPLEVGGTKGAAL